jgi:hypothetical protein
MLIKDQPVSVRPIDTEDDFAETRLEAAGYIFHGVFSDPDAKKPARPKAGSNVLHFARCAKLDKVPTSDTKIWYRTIRVAKAHLDEHVGNGRWKWCKVCEREITQKFINEA